MPKFAKLFELENNNQVVIMERYDAREDLYYLDEITRIKNILCTLSNPLQNESLMDGMFDKYTKDDAKKYVLDMERMVNDATPEGKVGPTDFTKN